MDGFALSVMYPRKRKNTCSHRLITMRRFLPRLEMCDICWKPRLLRMIALQG